MDSNQAIDLYYSQLEQAFGAAQANCDLIEQQINLVCCRFRLQFASLALAQALLPALAHWFSLDGAAEVTADIVLSVWDSVENGFHPPAPPFEPADYVRYGWRAQAVDGDCYLTHDFVNQVIFAYNRKTRRGLCWMADSATISLYDRAAPLQTLFHWSLHEFGWRIIHAAALGVDSGGVLLIGSTGAGKSTTALSALAHPGRLRLLSDDKCLVSLEGEPQAAGLFGSAKLKGDILQLLPQFAAHLEGWDEHAKGGKGLLYPYQHYADQMIKTFPIKALVTLELTLLDNPTVVPASPARVFRSLGPSTIIWLPGAEKDHYRFMASLVRNLPCFTLRLSRNFQSNILALEGLLETAL